MEFISTIFLSGKTYEVKIDMADLFKDTDHWALYKYEKLLKKTDLRQYLLLKASNQDYNVVTTKDSHDQEVEKIAGAARIIFDIVLHCPFVPIEYICNLVVLMDRSKHPTFVCSSMRLPNGHFIDLSLESRAFTIIQEEIIQDLPATSKLSCSIEEEFSQIIMDDRTTGPSQKEMPQVEFGYQSPPELHSDQYDAITNGFNGMIAGQHPMDQEEMQLGITLQQSYDSLPHQALPQQPQLNEEDWSVQIMEDHGFTIESESEDSIESPETIPPNIEPKILPTETNRRAIYISGIVPGTEKNMSKETFTKFGTIEKIIKQSSRTAIIRFAEPDQAAAALSHMDGTTFKDKTISVTMARRKAQDRRQTEEVIKTNHPMEKLFHCGDK